MGEKIRVLAKGKIKNQEIIIELNKPLSKGKDQQIHIQSNDLRIELDLQDYIKYAFSILVAEKNLKTIKKID